MRAFASGFALCATLLGGVGAHFADDDELPRPATAVESPTLLVARSIPPADSKAAAPTVTPAPQPATPAVPAQAELLEVRKIWEQGEHNAFTDLTRYKDAFFCAFREAKAHVAPDGGIRILTSADGGAWESAAHITRPDVDLRDPKLAIMEDGRLMLTAAAVKKSSYRTLAWYSPDGRTWNEPIEIGETNVWLWRVTWNGPVAFGVGYGTTNQKLVRLYRSEDGAEFAPLVADLFRDQYPNEASLVFLPDDSALCLLRRDAGTNSAQLGTALPPYTEWTWRDLGRRIAAPNIMRLEDGRILAAGRSYAGAVRTSLLWLDPAAGQLTEFLKLPSGGDTGCPGLAIHDGLLWVSYYASHEGKASIYLAKVRLPAAG